MKSVNPGANPSSASQCGPNHVPGKTPSPGLPEVGIELLARAVERRVTEACHAGAAPRVREPVIHRGAQGRPERGVEQHGGQEGRVATREERRGGAVEHRDQIVSRRHPPWSSAARRMPRCRGARSGRGPCSPTCRRPRRPRRPTAVGRISTGPVAAPAATQDPAIDRLGPGIELPGPEQARRTDSRRTLHQRSVASRDRAAVPSSAATSSTRSISSASVRKFTMQTRSVNRPVQDGVGTEHPAVQLDPRHDPLVQRRQVGLARVGVQVGGQPRRDEPEARDRQPDRRAQLEVVPLLAPVRPGSGPAPHRGRSVARTHRARAPAARPTRAATRTRG